ncbi:hypothetical protein SAY86_014202 [Trapa natans]|uniref:Arabinanase/levansucrase/invertase n=1 Tax=Trapa natans TaxID=22666 RepID=A0AAN7QMM3_TRANT|nr:hypothetical protein SAY86_014202 [Trapa natans]
MGNFFVCLPLYDERDVAMARRTSKAVGRIARCRSGLVARTATGRYHPRIATKCTMRTGIDSANSPRNKNNTAVEVDTAASKARRLTVPPPDKVATSITSSRGLVLDLGLAGSWDSAEVGSPVVKRYVGDNEERWYMWYHGRSLGEEEEEEEDGTGDRDSIGLTTSCNGIHWSRGEGRVVRSCGDAGMVMECRDNWWAFDTESIRPSELVVMSSPMYSSVYWLYYTGYSSSGEVVVMDTPAGPVSNPERSLNRKSLHSLPGLACSQDGRNWARIEGDHHSGALLDVGSGSEWDSLFIAGPQVVVHGSDDVRMYYHSFDRETGRYAVGLARSRDGIRWVKCGKIMVGDGPTGSFDEIGIKSVSVAKMGRDGTYLMAYEAVAEDGRTSIGMAESEDGLRCWRRLGEGPVLEASGTDGWDSWGVGSPCLVPMEGHEDEWRIYYVGTSLGGRTGIGMAISKGGDTGSFGRWSGISL